MTRSGAGIRASPARAGCGTSHLGCPHGHAALQLVRRDGVFARERSLFAHAWQYAGHAGQLAEPGSYFTARAGDVPLVVVRDREGELRAFLNVCRHRGAEVVSGRGPLHDAPVPLPRLDLRPGRRAAGGAAGRGRVRPFGARPASRAGRHLGAVHLRQRRRRRRAAGRHPGRAAGAGARRAAPTSTPSSSTTAATTRSTANWKVAVRELPRVLSLRGRAPGLQRRGRRLARVLPAGAASDLRQPSRSTARRRGRRRIPPGLAEHQGEHLAGPPRTCRSVACSRSRQGRRTASSTTSSQGTWTRRG